jgi:hypothetical protein
MSGTNVNLKYQHRKMPLIGAFNRWTKPQLMPVLLALIVSCVSVIASDIRIVSTCRTNKSGSISTREAFIREGQTNLVRLTTSRAGVVQTQVHRFYHKGLLIGDYVVMRDSSGFTTEAGCPYSVSLEFWPSREVRSVVFGTNGIAIDAFMATNGLFYPADTAFIRKANGFAGDLSKLLSPSHVTNTTPDKFGREVEQFIQEHKDKQ